MIKAKSILNLAIVCVLASSASFTSFDDDIKKTKEDAASHGRYWGPKWGSCLEIPHTQITKKKWNGRNSPPCSAGDVISKSGIALGKVLDNQPKGLTSNGAERIPANWQLSELRLVKISIGSEPHWYWLASYDFGGTPVWTHDVCVTMSGEAIMPEVTERDPEDLSLIHI